MDPTTAIAAGELFIKFRDLAKGYGPALLTLISVFILAVPPGWAPDQVFDVRQKYGFWLTMMLLVGGFFLLSGVARRIRNWGAIRIQKVKLLERLESLDATALKIWQIGYYRQGTIPALLEGVPLEEYQEALEQILTTGLAELQHGVHDSSYEIPLKYMQTYALIVDDAHAEQARLRIMKARAKA